MSIAVRPLIVAAVLVLLSAGCSRGSQSEADGRFADQANRICVGALPRRVSTEGRRARPPTRRELERIEVALVQLRALDAPTNVRETYAIWLDAIEQKRQAGARARAWAERALRATRLGDDRKARGAEIAAVQAYERFLERDRYAEGLAAQFGLSRCEELL